METLSRQILLLTPFLLLIIRMARRQLLHDNLPQATLRPFPLRQRYLRLSFLRWQVQMVAGRLVKGKLDSRSAKPPLLRPRISAPSFIGEMFGAFLTPLLSKVLRARSLPIMTFVRSSRVPLLPGTERLVWTETKLLPLFTIILRPSPEQQTPPGPLTGTKNWKSPPFRLSMS